MKSGFIWLGLGWLLPMSLLQFYSFQILLVKKGDMQLLPVIDLTTKTITPMYPLITLNVHFELKERMHAGY